MGRFHISVKLWVFLISVNVNQNIGHAGSVTWPPRYSDLTPLDFFIWGLEKYFLQDEYTDEGGTLCVELWMLLLTC
jgi:hypothetical protein